MSGGSGARVLLVEDDEYLRAEIGEYLVRRGHGVTPCGSLAEAHATFDRMLAQGPPEAIICDINLPDGNGADFCRDSARRLPTGRWILMSGGHEPEELAERLGEEPRPPRWLIVDKPVSMRTLNEALS